MTASLLLSATGFAQDQPARPHAEWWDYAGAPDSAQYSSLNQINATNVAQLRVAWTFPTGDSNKYFFNPLMADGKLFVLARNNSIIALDPATGKTIWIHNADAKTTLITSRGLNYWESKDRTDRRLLFASDHFLQAIDERDGKSITSFGKNGRVDLKEGLGRDPNTITLVQSTTPGRIYNDTLIIGSATGQAYGSAPGDIRAIDVRTGELKWTFHTIPHPGEFGYNTWPPEAWKTAGGANSWGGLSLDEKRGIIYIPTASPKYNFYGGDRIGADLFGDCLLALDARTGKRLWHFQTVHHDIWDYDNNTAPQLLTVQHEGKAVDVVAQATKQGFLYVFDRVSGQPLWPMPEKPVPQTEVPGEQTWPTQPFPTKPPAFARQKFTADDLSPYITDPAERAHWRDEIQSARNEGLFTPPALINTIQMPGNVGGSNWGSAASDPKNGMVFVESKDFPTMLKMKREVERPIPTTGSMEDRGHAIFAANCESCHGTDRRGQPPAIPSLADVGTRLKPDQIRLTISQGKGLMPAFIGYSGDVLNYLVAYLSHPEKSPQAPATLAVDGDAAKGPQRYTSGFGYLTTKDGLSPIGPPWTSLTAYDLNEGTIKWKIPLGEVPELAAKGHANTGAHFPKGGPVVTAGGILFTQTRDHKVRAFDEATGRELWQATLDSALEGLPAVYSVDGREYVVFCAAAPDAGYGKQTQIHGAYVAFSLPRP